LTSKCPFKTLTTKTEEATNMDVFNIDVCSHCMLVASCIFVVESF
jgi:hypothetical protein